MICTEYNALCILDKQAQIEAFNTIRGGPFRSSSWMCEEGFLLTSLSKICNLYLTVMTLDLVIPWLDQFQN